MWTAHLYQSISGKIGPRLSYESLAWSVELNGIESIQLTLKKSDLPPVDLTKWLSAWWAGVVLFWDGVPVVAGPITTRPSESWDSVSINCGGIRSILAGRVVVEEQSDWSKLSKSIISYNGLSLGTIAQRVVQKAQTKPAGKLPITFALPEQGGSIDGYHQRNYKGFDLQNLSCDSILTKLSNVIEGPDIMFKPRLVRGNQLTFDLWHGTEDHPRIAQQFTKVWDTTPQKGQVADMTVNYTGTYQASRVFSLGAGSDEKMIVTVSTNNAPLQHDYPLLERVINRGSSENPVTVKSHGDAELAANEDALLEIQMTVRGDTEIPFGSFWPGDLALVYTKGWLSIPDGMTPMRILSLTGDGTNNVKVSLQMDSKFDKSSQDEE